MILVAVNRRHLASHRSLAIGDGDRFMLGRKPDPNAIPAEVHDGGILLELATGGMDGMISRTHAWGYRQNNFLIINRIPPQEGKTTPHPIFSSVSNEQLPDQVTLAPGQSVRFGESGSLEFHWVNQLEDLPSAEAAADVNHSIESDTCYSNSTLPLAELQDQISLLQGKLPSILLHLHDPDTLFTRVAGLLQQAMSGEKAGILFLSVREKDDSLEVSEVASAGHRHADFRYSRQIMDDVYLDTHASPGIPRVITQKQAAREEQLGGAAPSLSHEYSWVVAVPVGYFLPRSGGGETFHDFKMNGARLCLYVESRDSVFPPRVFLPLFRLLTSLVSSGMKHNSRLDQEKQFQEANLAQYKNWVPDDLLDSIPRPGPSQGASCGISGTSFMLSTVYAGMRNSGEELERRCHSLRQLRQAAHDHGGFLVETNARSASALIGWPEPECFQKTVDLALALVRKNHQAGISESVLIDRGTLILAQTGIPTNTQLLCAGAPCQRLDALISSLPGELRFPVLLSHPVAVLARQAGMTVRRLFRFVEYGADDDPFSCYELVIGEGEGGSPLSPMEIEKYEDALEAWQNGDTTTCRELLEDMAGTDAASRWLLEQLPGA